MANRTDSTARQIHGMNPQYILETILRNKIYNSMYWKEKCFALTSETIIDRALELKYIGGSIGGNKSPTDFMCLILKLLQLQPNKDIILEYLNNKDYKYLTALAAYYIRLTSKPKDVYIELEPLYVDYRKLRVRNSDGSFKIMHMDEYIEELIYNEVGFEVTLPVIPKRRILEANEDLEPRVSILEADLSFNSSENDENENICDSNEKNEDNNTDYLNDIYLENYNQKKNIDNSDSESSYDTEEKFNGIKEKLNNEKYLNKKRNNDNNTKNNRFVEDKDNKKINKDNTSNDRDVKVDENSVDYWMNLRKKLGIN